MRKLVAIALTLSLVAPVLADTLSSANYTFHMTTISSGGGVAVYNDGASDVYSLMSSVGQSGGVGLMDTSSGGDNYDMNNGMLALYGDDPAISGNDPLTATVARNSTCSNPVNNFTFTASDGDSDTSLLEWVIETNGTLGTATIETATTGNTIDVCYTPDPATTGDDTFVVLAYDGSGGFDTVTVEVAISDARIVTWKSLQTPTGTPIAVNVVDDESPELLVETRQVGVTQIRVTFNEAMQTVDEDAPVPSDVQVSDGSTSYIPDTVEFVGGGLSGSELDIIFSTPLPDQNRYSVSLGDNFKNLSGALLVGENEAEIRALVGDSTGDGLVNLIDVANIKARNRTPVTETSAQYDLNGDNNINLIDMALARSRAQNTAP